MGNSNSTEAENDQQLYDPNLYTREANIMDRRYGDCKILRENNSNRKLAIVNKVVNDEAQNDELMRQLKKEIALEHDSLARIINFAINQEQQLCSSNWNAKILFQFLDRDLESDVNLRKQNNNVFYEQGELWHILISVIYAVGYLQSNGIYHQDIRPSTILINNEGVVKIFYSQIINDNINCFTEILMGVRTENIFISPIHFRALEKKERLPSHQPTQTDIFNLGLVILSCSLLTNIDDIFSMINLEVRSDLVENYLQSASLRYSTHLISLLRKMLQIDEMQRCDILELCHDIETLNKNGNIIVSERLYSSSQFKNFSKSKVVPTPINSLHDVQQTPPQSNDMIESQNFKFPVSPITNQSSQEPSPQNNQLQNESVVIDKQIAPYNPPARPPINPLRDQIQLQRPYYQPDHQNENRQDQLDRERYNRLVDRYEGYGENLRERQKSFTNLDPRDRYNDSHYNYDDQRQNFQEPSRDSQLIMPISHSEDHDYFDNFQKYRDEPRKDSQYFRKQSDYNKLDPYVVNPIELKYEKEYDRPDPYYQRQIGYIPEDVYHELEKPNPDGKKRVIPIEIIETSEPYYLEEPIQVYKEDPVHVYREDPIRHETEDDRQRRFQELRRDNERYFDKLLREEQENERYRARQLGNSRRKEPEYTNYYPELSDLVKKYNLKDSRLDAYSNPPPPPPPPQSYSNNYDDYQPLSRRYPQIHSNNGNKGPINFKLDSEFDILHSNRKNLDKPSDNFKRRPENDFGRGTQYEQTLQDIYGSKLGRNILEKNNNQGTLGGQKSPYSQIPVLGNNLKFNDPLLENSFINQSTHSSRAHYDDYKRTFRGDDKYNQDKYLY